MVLAAAAVSTMVPLLGVSGAQPTIDLPEAELPGFWTGLANGDRVNALVRDGQTAWAATAGGVVRWNLADGSHDQFLSPQHGLPAGDVRDLVEADDGTLWSATASGVARLSPGAARWRSLNMEHPDLLSHSATALALAPDGALWVGFEQEWDSAAAGPVPSVAGSFVGGGVARYDPGSGQWGPVYRAEPLDRYGETFVTIPSDNVTSLAVTPGGELWVGSRPYFVWDEDVDRGEGAWLRTGGGIAATDGARWVSWFPAGPREACLSTHVTSLAVDSSGRLWAGTIGRGLQVFRNGLDTAVCSYLTGHNWYTFQRGAGPTQTIAGNFVWSVAFDDAGRVFAGVGQGFDKALGISVLEHHETFEDPNRAWESDDVWLSFGLDGRVDSVEAHVSAISIGDGELLAGTRVGSDEAGGWGVKRRADDGTWSTLATADSGLPSNRITSLAVDHSTGAVWLGTADRGIARWDGESWDHWRSFDRGPAVTASVADVPAGETQVTLGIGSTEFATAFGGDPRYIYFGTDPTLYRIVGSQSVPPNVIVRLEPKLSVPVPAGTTAHTMEDGPPSDRVEDIAIDSEGRAWVVGQPTIWGGNDCPTFPDCWLDGGLSVLDSGTWLDAEKLGAGLDLPELRAVETVGDQVWAGAAVANQGREVALAAYDWQGEEWIVHGPEEGIGPGGVTDIYYDPQSGTLWTAHEAVMGCDPDGAMDCTPKRLGGGISRWDGGRWDGWTKPTATGMVAFGEEGDFTSVLYDPSRNWAWAGAWEAGPDGFHWNSGTGIHTAVSRCPEPCTAEAWDGALFAADGPVSDIALDSAGRVWFGSSRERLGTIPPDAGVRLLIDEAWFQLSARESGLPDDRVTALAAHSSAVWVGTYDRGAAVWRQMIPVDYLYLPRVRR